MISANRKKLIFIIIGAVIILAVIGILLFGKGSLGNRNNGVPPKEIKEIEEPSEFPPSQADKKDKTVKGETKDSSKKEEKEKDGDASGNTAGSSVEEPDSSNAKPVN